MKCFEVEFSELAIDPKIGLKDYSPLYKHGIRLKNFLANKSVSTDIKSGRTPSRFNADYWGGDYEFLTMQDVDDLSFSLNERCVDKITDIAIDEEKTLYKARANALIVSNAMTLGLSFLTDREVYINQNVFEINLDESKINKKFALWYFNLVIRPLFLNTYTAKYLSKDELGRIKIPAIPKTIQDQIVAKIEPIEQKIKDLKNQIKKPQEVINKVFAREFGFDENLYNEFGKGMTAGTQIANDKTLRFFQTDFTGLARSEILRFSTRYHNLPTRKLMDILDVIETVKVKDIVLEAIHRGASPVYSENGLIPVVKTGHLKNGYIEISQEEFVEDKFYKSSIRSQIRNGDILIASTGKVSLGKIDLVETEEELVADGHLSIIRVDEKKCNRLFLVYFFRSVLGYFQIERDFTGATNQIELYANEIGNFLIPNLPLTHQQKIVDEIKLELDLQEQIKKQIEAERQKIDAIIEQVISS